MIAMPIDAALAAVYFLVFAAIALGGWLYGKRLDPRVLKPWYIPFSLLSIAVLGTLLLAPPFVGGQYLLGAIAGVVIVATAYILVAKIRVCETCGTVAPPRNLITPADACVKCGSALSPNKIVTSMAARRSREAEVPRY